MGLTNWEIRISTFAFHMSIHVDDLPSQLGFCVYSTFNLQKDLCVFKKNECVGTKTNFVALDISVISRQAVLHYVLRSVSNHLRFQWLSQVRNVVDWTTHVFLLFSEWMERLSSAIYELHFDGRGRPCLFLSTISQYLTEDENFVFFAPPVLISGTRRPITQYFHSVVHFNMYNCDEQRA